MKELIKNFIERNKPIFAIGTATLILFVGIIVYYRITPHKETGLSRIGNESNFNIVGEEKTNMENEGIYSGSETSTSIEASLDEKVGILEIEYNENGFYPKAARAVQGQAVRWTNKTDKAIYLKQKTPTYTDLLQPVQIDPGQSFSYRLMKYGTWNYEEDVTKYFAYIEVYKFSP